MMKSLQNNQIQKSLSKWVEPYWKIWKAKEQTLDTLWRYIQGNYIHVDNYGNITVSNKKDSSRLPAFCCHLDTVHDKAPDPIAPGYYVMYSKNGYGIGGDDKCGVLCCIELLKHVPCKVIFFRDEEVGCKGSKEYNVNTLGGNKFLIEIDRKGYGNIIQHSGSEQLCSDEFAQEMLRLMPGYKLESGIYTDVNVLGNAGINMANISCGYYHPHTKNEHVIIPQLHNTFCALLSFAKNFDKEMTWERPARIYNSFAFPDAKIYRPLGHIFDKDIKETLDNDDKESYDMFTDFDRRDVE